MTIPESTDPAGASTPEPSLDGTQQLLDGAALESEDTAAPAEGDEALRAAEERRPLEREAPYEGSQGRS